MFTMMMFVGNTMTATLFPEDLTEAMKMLQENKDWNTFQIIGDNINLFGARNGSKVEVNK
jgi:hypothetical protein